ncbi:MAG: polyprenyl synthetase family protein [Pedobacter sp.]|nr:MAG: polyprenyl synthetase family protein [Pedobacter sp.]
MHAVNDLYQLANQAIARSVYTLGPKELYEPITYMMDLGGKRVRPILLLMACSLFSDDLQQAMDPAVGIELFHNFTLMHDDIMDHAPTRRGKPAVHEKWSDTTAILSGDVMLIEAYKRIMCVDAAILPSILSIFNDIAVGVCQGQQMDMNFERQDHIHVDDYLEMIRLKTAVLLGGALKIGALIGGGSGEDAALLYNFGETIGIAFQLQDDLLDVYGDPEKFGKQVGGDILSNKKTFLLIKAQELADGETKEQLDSWLVNSQADSQQKINAVTAIYNRLNIRCIVEEARNSFMDRALLSLDQLRVSEDKKVGLSSFAEQILVRER